MTNTKKRPIIALITATVLTFSIFIFGSVVGADATYSKAYTMGNVLTDYQYFVRGDFNTSGHIVGSIAIGGTMDAGTTFGDGMIAPSYINNIKNALLTGSDYTPDEKIVYYATNSSGNSLESRFINNPNYMDIESAFKKLEQESVAITTRATKTFSIDDLDFINTPVYSRGMITINLSELEAFDEVNVVIPYSVFKETGVINIVGYDHIDYIKENKVFISITDVDSGETPHLFFGYPGSTSVTSVAWNGGFHEMFLNRPDIGLSGGTNGNEVNLEGMKLVWNFPDAETVEVSSLAGHIFAPNADLEIKGGNRHEGGIIANSLIHDNASEAHYYPYYNPRTSFEEKPDETTTNPSETTTNQGEVTTAPNTTTNQGEVTTAPSTTTNQGEVTTAPNTTTNQGEVTTAPNTTTNQGEVTTAPNTTTNQGEVTTAPNTTTNQGEVTTAPNTTTNQGEVTTAPNTTTNQGEVTTAPNTTTNQGEVTTAPNTTTNQGEVTTAPNTTTNQGEVTTAPNTTTNQGEVTTAPSTTTSQGENTTVPSATTSQGENTSTPKETTSDNSNSTSTSDDGSNISGGTGDSNSTNIDGGSADGNGTNIDGGSGDGNGTNIDGGSSSNPDSGTGSLVGFATASFLVAITLSVATRKKKDD